MRILFLTSQHNSLSQRLFVELRERGHDIEVRVVAKSGEMTEAATREAPELIIAPMLKIAIPEQVLSRFLCLIIHPGIVGDRGPSSLDWAIADGEKSWGASVLEAAPRFDEGPIWASQEFSLPSEPPAKSSLYRGPVTKAAVACVLEAVARLESGEFKSGSWRPQDLSDAFEHARGRLRPPMRQADRAIDWTRDDAASIIRKIRAADSAPGVLAKLSGQSCFLYGAHHEDRIKGPPGRILAQRDGAICVGAIDGALWISHLKSRSAPAACEAACRNARFDADSEACEEPFCAIAGLKLPAARLLGPLVRHAPEAPLPIDAPADHRTFREIVYSEDREVGYLAFDFYNGAMSTEQCHRLTEAFLYARSRPTRVIALLGGSDFWSNGINLNTIEASADPAEESWRNINAIDDLVCAIINTMSHLVIAGLRGNAGAGGATLALAADRVYAMSGVVLNPHYRSMGGLYGSEYWTYLLPRRVGRTKALELTQGCQPIGARAARDIGFVDDVFGEDAAAFEAELRKRAARLAADSDFCAMLRRKRERRFADERIKPLAKYRAEELEKMRVNFFGADPAHHEARRRFVFKGEPPPRSRLSLRAKAGMAPAGADAAMRLKASDLSPRP